MKFDVFSRKSVGKFNFNWNLTGITGTLHEEQYTFFITSRLIILRMRNVSGKNYIENQNTRFTSNIFFNRAVYEIIWGNVLEPGRPQIKYSACALRVRNLKLQTNKHTHTHTHTHTICNNYCFSTATMVARMRFNFALNVQYLDCLVILYMSFMLLTWPNIRIWKILLLSTELKINYCFYGMVFVCFKRR